MKQVHKYKVDEPIWYGEYLAKVLRRLDNQMYQIKYQDSRHWYIEVVPENHLSLVPNPNFKVTHQKVSIKRKNDRELISKRIWD